jgi:tRNA A-37 threonylcarbamoyl transferase component Bud32
VKHGDVHYGNFILDADFAYIIDFGLSSVCFDKAELKREKELLIWKLDNNDDSGDQKITH